MNRVTPADADVLPAAQEGGEDRVPAVGEGSPQHRGPRGAHLSSRGELSS